MFKRSRTLRPKIGWRARVKRWLFWLGFAWLLLCVLNFMNTVDMVPDYRGGMAYVSYSPYGHYKMSLIFVSQKHGNRGRSFYLVSSMPENKPLAIYLVPRDWTAGFSDLWLCKKPPPKSDKNPCYAYMVTTYTELFPDIPLPPDLWHRLVAWAFFRLHPWQDEKLEEKLTTPHPLFYCVNGQCASS